VLFRSPQNPKTPKPLNVRLMDNADNNFHSEVISIDSLGSSGHDALEDVSCCRLILDLFLKEI
jgi:hypothetical protein